MAVDKCFAFQTLDGMSLLLFFFIPTMESSTTPEELHPLNPAVPKADRTFIGIAGAGRIGEIPGSRSVSFKEISSYL